MKIKLTSAACESLRAVRRRRSTKAIKRTYVPLLAMDVSEGQVVDVPANRVAKAVALVKGGNFEPADESSADEIRIELKAERKALEAEAKKVAAELEADPETDPKEFEKLERKAESLAGYLKSNVECDVRLSGKLSKSASSSAKEDSTAKSAKEEK